MNRTLPLTSALCSALLAVTACSQTANVAVESSTTPPLPSIVDPDWVVEHASSPDLRILDVRGSVSDYQHGHVPGAVHIDDSAFRAPRRGVPVQYLEPDEMSALMRRAGIGRTDRVVVYSDGENVLGATMVTYCLRSLGHDRVAVLDGGFRAYRKRHPCDQQYPEIDGSDFRPQPDPSVTIDLDGLRELIGDPAVTLLDTRPVEDYLGNTHRWIRNGHIPGAINLEWRQLTQPDNPHAFKSADEIRKIVTDMGLTPEDDIILYCGTSREASLAFHALSSILGYPKVRLYEGSWTEYCADEDLPVERTNRTPRMATAEAAHRAVHTERLEPYECGDITTLHTFKGVFLASQPSPSDLEQAKKGGVMTVVNLRHPGEVDALDEEALVSALGLTYHNPAWNGPEELTDEVFDRTRKLLREAKRPILMHCSSANRTGAIWLAYRALDDGLELEKAVQEARTSGLRSPAYERIARDYVRRMQQRDQW